MSDPNMRSRPDGPPHPAPRPHQYPVTGIAARKIGLRGRVAALLVFVTVGAPSAIDNARAALDCRLPADLPPENLAVSARHHPVGKPLPQQPTFRQPDECDRGVWFYDDNQNRRADPEEPQLYGSDRMLACSSCHAQSDIAQPAEAAALFLRQDASKLCLVCHNL